MGLKVPTIGAGVVGAGSITPFGQSACAKHCSPDGLMNVKMDENDNGFTIKKDVTLNRALPL